jgi:hypothetical protein
MKTALGSGLGLARRFCEGQGAVFNRAGKPGLKPGLARASRQKHTQRALFFFFFFFLFIII